MDDPVRAAIETEVRTLCDQGDHAAAATAMLRGYGPELLGFLVSVLNDDLAAGDVFADLAEAIWRSLPRFSWRSSARTWAYVLARNISRNRVRDDARRRRRVALPGDSYFHELAEKVRTETQAFLRTTRKTRLQALRDTLPEEDRMLLVLRVDRDLSWNDLARVLAESREDEESFDDATLARDAARLRKRFQAVKDRLRELARQEGLLE